MHIGSRPKPPTWREAQGARVLAGLYGDELRLMGAVAARDVVARVKARTRSWAGPGTRGRPLSPPPA